MTQERGGAVAPSRRLVRWPLIGFLLGAVLTLASPTLAQDDCATAVSPDESIQTAINGAQEGAVICLEAGTWETNLAIEKGLTLRGEGPENTVIKGVAADEAVVTIHGIDIFSDSESQEDAYTVNLQGLAIVGGSQGISMAGTETGHSHVTIANAHIHGHGTSGLFLGYSETAVRNSTITGYSTGVWVAARPGGTSLHNVTIKWTNIGVSAMRFARFGILGELSIVNSTISDNWQLGIGIVDSPKKITLTGNYIRNNGIYGVALLEQPCGDPAEIEYGDESYERTFSSLLTGSGNTIPGSDEPDGNGRQGVCPSGKLPICHVGEIS